MSNTPTLLAPRPVCCDGCGATIYPGDVSLMVARERFCARPSCLEYVFQVTGDLLRQLQRLNDALHEEDRERGLSVLRTATNRPQAAKNLHRVQ